MKFLIVVSVFVFVLTYAQKCKVGQHNIINGGLCRCMQLNNGRILWGCIKSDYNKPTFRKRNAGKLLSEIRSRKDIDECTIGDTKVIDCNDCHCNQFADGIAKWVCSTKTCPKPSPLPHDAKECTLGDTKTNNCNRCECVILKNGKSVWKCSKNTCSNAIIRTKRDSALSADFKDMPCTTNDSFVIDCTTCYCNNNYGYLCTDNTCDRTELDSTTATENTTSTVASTSQTSLANTSSTAGL